MIRIRFVLFQELLISFLFPIHSHIYKPEELSIQFFQAKKINKKTNRNIIDCLFVHKIKCKTKYEQTITDHEKMLHMSKSTRLRYIYQYLWPIHSQLRIRYEWEKDHKWSKKKRIENCIVRVSRFTLCRRERKTIKKQRSIFCVFVHFHFHPFLIFDIFYVAQSFILFLLYASRDKKCIRFEMNVELANTNLKQYEFLFFLPGRLRSLAVFTV